MTREEFQEKVKEISDELADVVNNKPYLRGDLSYTQRLDEVSVDLVELLDDVKDAQGFDAEDEEDHEAGHYDETEEKEKGE